MDNLYNKVFKEWEYLIKMKEDIVNHEYYQGNHRTFNDKKFKETMLHTYKYFKPINEMQSMPIHEFGDTINFSKSVDIINLMSSYSQELSLGLSDMLVESYTIASQKVVQSFINTLVCLYNKKLTEEIAVFHDYGITIYNVKTGNLTELVDKMRL